MTNLVRDLDEAIDEFVRDPRYQELQKGTGPWCTPFRGGLFGSSTGSEVTALLTSSDPARRRRAQVLVVGSNPNVPGSLAAIRGEGRAGPDVYQAFRAQMAMDHFGHELDEHGRPAEESWDPMNASIAPSWARFMSGVVRPLSKTSAADDIAMANFLPWGSKDFPTFFGQEGVGGSQDLRGPIVELSVRLHLLVVRALDPAVVFVPFSLSRAKDREGQPLLPTLGSITAGLATRTCRINPKAQMRFQVGRVEYVERPRVVVIAPHASWYPRVQGPSWDALSSEMVNAVNELI